MDPTRTGPRENSTLGQLSWRHELPPLVGVVENVRSLWNVGSMFRTADGAGVGHLFLCGFTGHPPRAEISKTALGAEECVGWEYWSRAPELCLRLRAAGYQVLALERTSGSVTLEQVEITPRLALVVGHEIRGISEETLQACDLRVGLPMRGMKESLNVAVAFGIATYRLRERWEAIRVRSDGDARSRDHSRSPAL